MDKIRAFQQLQPGSMLTRRELTSLLGKHPPQESLTVSFHDGPVREQRHLRRTVIEMWEVSK